VEEEEHDRPLQILKKKIIFDYYITNSNDTEKKYILI